MTSATEQPEYRIVVGPPPLEDYLRLRRESGLSPKDPAQGAGAIAGSWSACHVVDEHGTPVAMGRTIGDGGWYFHIADIATDPAHQRRGLGRRVVEWLLADIRDRAPAGAYVTLVGDPPGQRLYRSLGFDDVAPSLGMALRLE
ncbi:GNAT family N-acetyltransferase [Curtobacterium aurantiacum]|uniref:GNAT family N-acetyltransferase n=1 Tax=Curtobacterium aurantiacum TaxID=3236919 RepID=A0ABS5VC76_9MICO|nr:GNAT family N-acetyltransferase [Curtobacterium flaccumfaciens]MBT1544335.1 GNAT family N-acetyltransferase [Curtobacterium flaccumfaciens pv. flaccumfaciens]MBT1587086.1 GNAT family N-acetyltransferase [Curtobacterium flaccumfaciens pv. flaccumfaciens]